MEPVEWLGNRLKMIDQSKLPGEELYLTTEDYREVARCIKELRVRGAPTIGVAAAYGITLGAQGIRTENRDEFLTKLSQVVETMASTRPTAVNLFKTIERMEAIAKKGGSIREIKERLLSEAIRIHTEERDSTRQLGEFGAALIPNRATILTHCNAGPLATCGYGTALGVIHFAAEQGKGVSVFADETRPLLQGARLTVWELMRDNIPVTLITDSMAGCLMHQNRIDCVVVGADRIAANGDVANKIGTYMVAVLAKENHVPFYVAAPTSTIDLSLSSGAEIPIEERDPLEVTCLQGVSLAPEGVRVFNPAFDVTSCYYVSAIITEKGVAYPPYRSSLREL